MLGNAHTKSHDFLDCDTNAGTHAESVENCLGERHCHDVCGSDALADGVGLKDAFPDANHLCGTHPIANAERISNANPNRDVFRFAFEDAIAF